MKTNKNITKAKTTQAYFTTKEVAVIIGITTQSITAFVRNHPTLAPNHKGSQGRNGTYLWTADEVDRLVAFRKAHNGDIDHTETKITIPETNKSTAISTNADTPETLISMFDAFLYEEQEEEHNENRAANRKFRNLFESMTEADIQKFFEPLTERFKFSYVTKIVGEVQSQTLTCIRKGKLKGIAKYELTYKAFLHLCKFAAENNCPLNLPAQTQEVNI